MLLINWYTLLCMQSDGIIHTKVDDVGSQSQTQTYSAGSKRGPWPGRLYLRKHNTKPSVFPKDNNLRWGWKLLEMWMVSLEVSCALCCCHFSYRHRWHIALSNSICVLCGLGHTEHLSLHWLSLCLYECVLGNVNVHCYACRSHNVNAHTSVGTSLNLLTLPSTIVIALDQRFQT